jgi:Short C-terminal domain
MKTPFAIRFCAAVCPFFLIPPAFAQMNRVPAGAPAQAAQREGSGESGATSAALSPEAKKKLAALDAALKSGVLTKDEYEAKKNALYADSNTQAARAAKLDALEKAYQAGVLTKDEYELKKKELVGVADSNDRRPRSDSNSFPSSSAAPVRSATGTARNGWTEHDDPTGFSVDTPAGWDVTRDTGPGSITVRGQRGERAVIWPMFVEKNQLGPREAGTLVQQLARKVDGQMPWGRADLSQNAVRAIARDGQRSGAALMTWSAGPNGTTVFFYCLEAPADIYRSSTDAFVGILRSFRVLQDPALKNASARETTTRAPLRFVSWSDPHENAFTMAVPEGWRIIGGAYRLTATDIRNGVMMVSPDSQIRVVVGDSSLGVYTEPNPMLALGGLREGGHQALGDGTQLEIRRYLSGQQFARAYAQAFSQRQCPGLRIESNNARPDLASAFLQSARAEGMPNPQLTAGDVSITCNLNGIPVRGVLVVATVVPFPGQAGLWYVYRLYGYLAPPDRQKDAEAVYQQAIQSWHINPEWQAREQQIANNAVQQDNARSQQIRARAMQAIQDDQRHISDTIVKGYEQRSRVYDEISRRRENAILGEVDVVDPESGTQYKVDNYSDYHWMNNQEDILGTQTHTSPGPDWRELVTLP